MYCKSCYIDFLSLSHFRFNRSIMYCKFCKGYNRIWDNGVLIEALCIVNRGSWDYHIPKAAVLIEALCIVSYLIK